jgi:hypothetical protein
MARRIPKPGRGKRDPDLALFVRDVRLCGFIPGILLVLDIFISLLVVIIFTTIVLIKSPSHHKKVTKIVVNILTTNGIFIVSRKKSDLRVL